MKKRKQEFSFLIRQQSKCYRTYEYAEGKNSITVSRKSKFPENTIPNSNSKTEDNLMFEENNSNQNTTLNKHTETEGSLIESEINTPSQNKQFEPVDAITD